MSIEFDCEGDVIRLHLSQSQEFSFLFLDYSSETYYLGNPGKRMIFEPDDRLLPWLVGQMAIQYVRLDYEELLDKVDEKQQIAIAAGFCLRDGGANDEILNAILDLEDVVYPELKSHLQQNWNESGMKRRIIRENYTYEELYNIRNQVENNVEPFVQARGFGPGPKFTDEDKKNLEIWALWNREYVPI